MANDSLTIATDASPGEVSRRLDRIEQTLDRLAGALDQAQAAAPSAVATAVDVMDELLLSAQARGIDIDALIRVAGNALGALAELAQSPEFATLVRSGALSADSVAMAARAGDALAQASAEPAGKAGILALWRASRDPDVQRALDFMLRFMKRFGRGLAERDQARNQDNHQDDHQASLPAGEEHSHV